MSLRSKFTTFSAALICAGSAFAQDQVCPDLMNIKSVGITMTSELGYNYFVGYTLDNFNTDFSWGFAIGPVEAGSDAEALEMTNEILAGMTGPGIPETDHNEFVCLYETGDPNIFAVAIQNFSGVSPMKFKQYIHKTH